MTRLLFSLLFPFFFTSLFAQTTELWTMNFDGEEREYFVYLPAGYTPGDQLPLVFNLHGITSTNGEQYSYTGVFGGFNAVADTAQIIMCYPNGLEIPNGTGSEWNVGFSFSNSTADDVGFINALIDTLHANYQINLDRVYATGMSNGGYLAYKLACEIPERFQAIASVTGSIVPEEFMKCNPATTIPVMQIHNTDDPVVAYAGSEFGVSMDDLLEKWVNENYCTPEKDSFSIPDIDPLDGSTVDKFVWDDCQGNRQVVHFRINGGGHTWPGSLLVFAPTNQDINASREVWEFFNQYQAPIAVRNEDILVADISVNISPNPFSDQLFISSPESPLQSIRLYDALGKRLFVQEKINASSYQINNLDLTPGIYYVQVKNEFGVDVFKIIKE